MKEKYRVPDSKKVRIIINADTACEADDQYAIAHALMTQKFIVKGITTEHFNNTGDESTCQKSFDETKRVLKLMNCEHIPVFLGSARPLESENSGYSNEAVDFIIEEALSDDEKPLFVLCQGALTNIASALLKQPDIASKMTCIWIGGAPYPNGGYEFNLCNDFCAANVVFKSQVELWQVPADCYAYMRVGYAELEQKVYPCGEVGKYLFEQMQALGNSEGGWWTIGESWSLGDSPAVGLAMDFCAGKYNVTQAPIVSSDGRYIGKNENRNIRVYYSVDSRFILEDFFAKLSIFYKSN